MTVDYEITEDKKRIKIRLIQGDCIDSCLTHFFDGATPTFKRDDVTGNLVAELESVLR